MLRERGDLQHHADGAKKLGLKLAVVHPVELLARSLD